MLVNYRRSAAIACLLRRSVKFGFYLLIFGFDLLVPGFDLLIVGFDLLIFGFDLLMFGFDLSFSSIMCKSIWKINVGESLCFGAYVV